MSKLQKEVDRLEGRTTICDDETPRHCLNIRRDMIGVRISVAVVILYLLEDLFRASWNQHNAACVPVMFACKSVMLCPFSKCLLSLPVDISLVKISFLS